MSTIVYQEILQSQIIEKTTLNLKIPSSIECNYQVKNLDLGGWSSLQNLPNISKESGVYIHPLSKKCSFFSEESLQLCTESLGSETGSDIIDTNIFSFPSKTEKSTSPETKFNDQPMMTATTESSSSSRNCKVTKSSSNKNFPPPLTTIRGLNSVQFKPHREDGRLIIKAIESQLTHNYYQAERSNGRLRLCFFKNEISAPPADTSDFDEIEDEIMENNIKDEQEEEEEIEGEQGIEEEEESDMHKLKRDVDGNKFDVEGEMGKEKCQRLSRCKESGGGNKAFCDWRKPLWVATS